MSKPPSSSSTPALDKLDGPALVGLVRNPATPLREAEAARDILFRMVGKEPPCRPVTLSPDTWIDRQLLAKDVDRIADDLSRAATDQVKDPRADPTEHAQTAKRGPAWELLETPPPVLVRPLQLIDGHAYAASWLWARGTFTTVDRKTGEAASTERTERMLLVMRDDGQQFGVTARPLAELGIDVQMATMPRDSKTWTKAGIERYTRGQRPAPADVFERVVSVFDCFLAFESSLSKQRVMCELLACWALASWLLDALEVAPYLWASGPAGSGKTKLANTVTEVAYLGESVSASSTFAAMRDLTEGGACVLFDDAEALTNPKTMDPDKRGLILSGNTRGSAYVVLQEQQPDGNHKLKRVWVFASRVFSAIQLPDATTASRCIVIPMARTGNRAKANADSSDLEHWPCDKRRLVDDLWALALGNLAAMPAHVKAAKRDAPIVGRTLDPWVGVLTVAHWLDSISASGLFGRMAELARTYQTERATLEYADRTRVVLRALLDVVAGVARVAGVAGHVQGCSSAVLQPATDGREAIAPKPHVKGNPVPFNTDMVTERANQIAEEEELWFPDSEAEDDASQPDAKKTKTKRYIANKGTSTELTRLRVPSARVIREGDKTPRIRELARTRINDIARAYGLPEPFCECGADDVADTAVGQTGPATHATSPTSATDADLLRWADELDQSGTEAKPVPA